MTKIKYSTMLGVLIIAIYVSGCELTKLPLVLDSSISGTIPVNITTPVSQYNDSIQINVSKLKEVTGETIDSLKLYNITLTVENLSPSNASISGNITVDGNQLLILNNMNLSQFNKERSIFDKNLTGFQYSYAGVKYLMDAIKQITTTQSPKDITIKLSTGSVSNPISFILKVKIYAQVFAGTD